MELRPYQAVSAGPAVRLTARPPNRLFYLVLESHDGRALVPIPKRSGHCGVPIWVNLKL